MIWHFMKSDLEDYQFYWMMVAVIVFLFWIVFEYTEQILYLYLAAYACVFLALLPVNYLTGVTWRAQHIMSRNYLLALPVSRKKMFDLILIRILVFWVPLWGMALYLPLELNRRIPYRLNHYGEYACLVFIGSIWVVNATIGMQLRFESIIRTMHQRQRIQAWALMLLEALLESVVYILCFLSLFRATALYAWVFLLLSLFILFRRYGSNLRKWM